MSDIAIRVEGLGKRYRIGRAQKRHDTLRDLIVSKLQRTNGQQQSDDTFWALKDVSFEVKRGEVVGIPSAPLRAGTGRTGAGKSTLPSTPLRTWLKILSRITEPSEGEADTYFGRIRARREVRLFTSGQIESARCSL
jgi:lipopolysaccharide transport system ATP-binding protein